MNITTNKKYKTRYYTQTAVLSMMLTAAGIAAADTVTINGKKVTIDARAGATQPDKQNNPFFISNLDTEFDSTSTTDSSDFTTTAEATPTLADGTLKAVYIENEGNQANSNTMDRTCTLIGNLAKNTDGSNSERLAISLYNKDGQPLPIQSSSAQPSSSEPFVYAGTTDTQRAFRYSLGSNERADIAVGCYSEIPGDYFTRLKCTRIEVVGEAAETDVESRIRCKVNEKATSGTEPLNWQDSFEN